MPEHKTRTVNRTSYGIGQYYRTFISFRIIRWVSDLALEHHLDSSFFFSLPLRQAKSITPHQNLDSTYTNEKFYENTKIKKSSFFCQKLKKIGKSNEKRNLKRNNEDRILEEHVLEHKKGDWLFLEYFPKIPNFSF